MARRRTARRPKSGGLDFSAIPAYFWLACLYGAIAFGSWAMGAPAETVIRPDAVEASATATATATAQPFLELRTNEAIAARLDQELFAIPMVAGDRIAISWTVIIILLAFLCSWIEAVRALKPRGKAYNDVGSILVTIPMIILMVGFEAFQTTAFLVIVTVGFGDIIIDRLVNQGVSYRDYYAL